MYMNMLTGKQTTAITQKKFRMDKEHSVRENEQKMGREIDLF